MRPALQRTAAASPPRYQHRERRRPEQTPLYRLVRAHYETFAAEVGRAATGALPRFVRDEFEAYLECGILAHGFLRLTCDTCTRDTLVAFSCKRRGICPSCGTRRMAETAAYLVDNILPRVAVRQWVLSFPIPLRSLFAVHPELLTPVLRILHRAIHTHLLKQAKVKREQAASGAITLIQRFGSAANLNTHLHALVLDGVYQTGEVEGASKFIEAPAPSNEQLQTLINKIIRRILKLLTRLGHLIEEDGITYLARSENIDPDDVMAPLQAAASIWRIAAGPRAGRKVLTLAGRGELREAHRSRELCANHQDFSLHAGVRCDANDRQGIEQLCRYITRPAISNERLSINREGNVVLKLKTPWRNGVTHIVLTPMEFMQRLAALVPRPRLHLIRFHGVLAPNAKMRSQVVPAPLQQTTKGESDCTHAHSKLVRMTWARLLKRVFDIDVEQCQCGGKLKLIAVIEEPAVIDKILTHLGLSPQPPPRAKARRVDMFGAD
jgi:Putative transposase/Transposase zinc-binding domain